MQLVTRCLGYTAEYSKIDEAQFRSGLHNEVVVNQILTGNYYNHAMEPHEITMQALPDLWFDEFFSEKPPIRYDLVGSVKLAEAFNMHDD